MREDRRQAHNAARMMSRIARKLTSEEVPPRRVEPLRASFLRHCDAYRATNGMGDGVWPPLPPVVSQLGQFSAERLDRIPYEELDRLSQEAGERGDWPLCDVLCVEIEHRDHLAQEHPADLAAVELDRRRAWCARLDPLARPAARSSRPLSKGEVERALRAEYESYVEMDMLAAERATNGQLFSPAGRNANATGRVSARALWTNHIVADRWASEELRRYWTARPRQTFASWREANVEGRHGAAQERVAKSSIINF
ncbi:MAG: hypothetical protein QM628_15535 [Propionicimonas sp.]